MASNDSNVLKSALTEGSSVKEIYMFGVKVWPICNGGCVPDPSESYYIKWTPETGPAYSSEIYVCGKVINTNDYYPSACYDTMPAILTLSNATWFRTMETNALTIEANGCQQMTSLQSVAFNGFYIAYRGFFSCSSLLSVQALNCVYVGTEAFENCFLLSSVMMENLYYIGQSGFKFCSNLTNVSFRNLMYLNRDVFIGCSSLRNGYFGKCISAGIQTFSQCHNLQSVYFPELKVLDNPIFYRCWSLKTVSLPQCEVMGRSNGGTMFYQCSSLSALDLPVCSIIYPGALSNCGLKWLILEHSSICSLPGGSSTFASTPLVDLFGSIFVPTSLVEAYKADSQWSYFSTVIVPIYANEP